MALVLSIDGPNRRVYLSSSTQDAEVHPIDIYKEVRALRRTNESLRKFDNFLEATGNLPKGGGKFTPRIVTCLQGTRIVVYNSTHVLTIIGEIITDEGTSGVDCFDRTLLSPGNYVDINYIPPQVEIITVQTGSAVTEQDKEDIANLSRIKMDEDSTKLESIKTKTDNLPEDPASQEKVDKIELDVSLIRSIELGRWKIDTENNQMIFYSEDNVTEVARYDLKDSNGNPSSSEVFERVKS